MIHADIDPAEIGKNRAADVPIVGDAKAVIRELVTALQQDTDGTKPDLSAWWAKLDELARDLSARLRHADRRHPRRRST